MGAPSDMNEEERKGADPEARSAQIARLLGEARAAQAAGASVDVEAICLLHPALLPELRAGLLKIRRVAMAMARSEELDRTAPQIPGYRVLEPLGEGGMGAVYKAEQLEPIRRIVAIKSIKPGFDTRSVIARFESERQALALMDHPHIAKVLNAGSDPLGRPYFVMEYVPGAPILEFADANRLTIPQRLQLFQQVCDAIAHAHTKALIHRDIKSTNVLAYNADGKPFVKVIDFGVAKALRGERLTDHTTPTTLGSIVGTYGYMSPEQAAGSADIDTRTDVYSLGVLLYELLAGVQPFDSRMLGRLAEEEMQRVIREEEPPRPSTKLSSMGNAAAAVAQARQTTTHALRQELTSELDWIPLMALRKERDRRYASVQDLSADVRNYLEQRPLNARPDSAWYRTRKMVHRNRVALAVGAACLLFAFVMVAGVTWRVGVERAKTLAAHAAAEQSAIELKRFNDGLEATRARAASLEAIAAEAQRATETSQRDFDAGGIEGKAERLALEAEQARAQVTLLENGIRGAENLSKALSEVAGKGNAGESEALPPPIAQYAMVRHPTRLGGVDSWTIETPTSRGELFGVSFSPDSKLLASAGGDQVVRIWDVAAAKQVRALYGHEEGVTCVAWSPDGKTLASGSEDSSVRLWDPSTGRQLGVLEGHLGSVRAVSWSPDGRKLVSASFDKTARIWDVKEQRTLLTYKEHLKGLNSVSWSSSDDLIASSGMDQTVRIWRASTGAPIETLHKTPKDFGTQYVQIAWSPDGRRLVWSDDLALRVWDAIDRKDVPLPEAAKTLGSSSGITWSPDGRWVFGVKVPPSYGTFDLETGKLAPALDRWYGVIYARASSPSGAIAALGDANGDLWLIDLPSCHLRAKLGCRILPVKTAEWSSKGDRLAFGAMNGRVEVWDPIRSARISQLTGREPPISFMSWSSDDRLLAASHYGVPIVHVWDVGTCQLMATIPGISSAVGPNAVGGAPQARFAPGTTTLAIAGSDGMIRIVDLRFPSNVKILAGHTTWLRRIAWSPDGTRLASADRSGALFIWDPERPEPIFKTLGHDGEIRSLVWSPDGTSILSAGDDRTIRIWDAETGRPRQILSGHRDHITHASWSTDGREIISFGTGGTLRRWLARWGTPLEARSVLGPGKFSPDMKSVVSVSGRVTLWDAQTGRAKQTILPFQDGKYAILNEDGSFTGSDGIEDELIFVAKTSQGQALHTPAEFAANYGWHNAAKASRLAAPSPSTLPTLDPRAMASAPAGIVPKRGSSTPDVAANASQRSPAALSAKAAALAGLEKFATLERDPLGTVIKVTLTGSQFTESDLVPLQELTQLKEFIVRPESPITNGSLAFLASSKATLTYIDLSGCAQIGDDGMKHLAGMPELVRLGIARTSVTDAGLAHLRGLKKLVLLYLGGTKVTDDGLDLFADLPNTGALLPPNTLTDRGLERLSNMQTLQQSVGEIYLGGTKITSKGLAFLPRFQRLGNVYLHGMPIDDSDLVTLTKIPRLGLLTLTDTKITDTGIAEVVRRAPQIVILNLQRTAITDAALHSLSAAKALQVLDLTSAPVTDEGLAQIRNLPLLESLNLTGTRVTDDGLLQHVPQMVQLASLKLSLSDLVTQAKISKLKDACPWVKIDASNDLGNKVWVDPKLTGGKAPGREDERKLINRLPQMATLERDASGSIIKVKITNPLFSDDDMASLRGLRHLKEFIAEGKAALITDRGLECLAGKESLELVNLAGAKGVTDAGMVHLEGLTHLVHLDLGYGTSVTNAGLARLAKLKQLRVLFLGDTPVRDEGIEFVRELPSLVGLGLTGTKITDQGLKTLSEVPSLQNSLLDFYIANTGVTSNGLEYLAKFPKMSNVFLHDLPISDSDVETLAKLPSLVSVALSKTRITDAGVAKIAIQMPRLQNLHLLGDHITDASLKSLAAAPALRYLNVAYTEVTDAGLAHLASSNMLQELDLYDTRITDVGLLQTLTKMPTLKRVTLQMNQNLTAIGIQKLREARPDLQINANP